MFDYKKAAVAASLVLAGTFSFAGSPTAPQTANIVDAAMGKELVGGSQDAFASTLLPRLRTSGGG